VCNICFGAANKHALGNVQNKLNVFSFIKLSGNTANTEEEMSHSNRSQLDPGTRARLFVIEVFELTFFFGLIVVLSRYGIDHLRDMAHGPWWLWASLPVIATVVRLAFIYYSRKEEKK
jgi:hypothetical protein